MPCSCSAIGCRSNYGVYENISVFKLPKDPVRRQLWLDAIGRPDFRPTEYTRLCVRHFEPRFVLTHDSVARDDGSVLTVKRDRVRLTQDAVPTLFGDRAETPLKSRGTEVEFKPEMWEEKENEEKNKEKNKEREQKEELTGEPPAKRGRGRPRKQPISDKSDSNVVVKSEPVVSCCALACPNTSENFSMHSLPSDPALRQQWVDKIDRLDWSPDDDSALCEVHFAEAAWDRDVGQERALRPDAVPSLFLHGEAIKSWVTLDHSGNIADIVVDGRSTNDEDSMNGGSNQGNTEESIYGSEIDEDEIPSIFVKREALEPEIDMVEGSEEDMVGRETSAGEQFETIYCDSTFNDHEDSEDRQYEDKEDEDMPLIIPTEEEENPLGEERSSPILQDGQVSCLEDSTKKPGTQEDGKYLVISMANKGDLNKDRVIRRRSSSQLTDEFQCPICERRLSRRKNLEIHMEKLHPHGEMSEYQRKKKEGLLTVKKPEEMKKTYSNPNFKKPPPPLKPIVPQCLLSPSIPIIPLNTPPTPASSAAEGVITSSFPILSFSAQSPLVSSSIQTTPSTVVTPTLVASQPLISSQPVVAPTALLASPGLVASSSAGTLLSSPSIVTTPCPLDPSPAGGEVRKQFLLLLPKQTVMPTPPPLQESPPPTPAAGKKEKTNYDEVSMFSVNLSEIPLDRRLRLKEKLKELVDAVIKKKLNPDKIIIAYDRT